MTRVTIEPAASPQIQPPRSNPLRDAAGPRRDDFSAMIDDTAPRKADPARIKSSDKPEPARSPANDRRDRADQTNTDANPPDRTQSPADTASAQPAQTPAQESAPPEAATDGTATDGKAKAEPDAAAGPADAAADTFASAAAIAAPSVAPQPIVPQTAAIPTAPAIPAPATAADAGPLSIAAAALAATAATVQAATPAKPASDATIVQPDATLVAAVTPPPPKLTTSGTQALETTGAKGSTGTAVDAKASTQTPAESTATAAPATDAKHPSAPHAATTDAQPVAKPDGAPTETKPTPPTHERHAAAQASLTDATPQNLTPVPAPAPTATTLATAAPQISVVASQIAPVPLNGLAMQIAATASSGKTSFDIRLDPAELGRIDVRLDVDRHGNVTSHLTVEKPETLAMLRQDAPQLQRALTDAGLQTSDKGLQFSLSDQSLTGQNNSQNNYSGDDRRAMQRLVIAEDDTLSIASAGRSYGRTLGSSSGVDIRI